ncbi:1-deoxy-D-xylulose-5-phosphate reductoisomerase [Dissulfurirhabdus thermomarina]|uniref:1-deoxy-D-xylulose 5-phosphate reductoisomerase n=1 Tax=Dissulfurirhabdus thermomarina TaxID=1765737 RepID=A0A6N9TPD5_DISTH|nr:1-deoxy-D-xylulose-5-phosphate reductoisomerase [Dissulfurirhabdus thermomarina]NDY43125.1 1-deoxy-D-xylulose-5-phosphate reductoisomerase [Dissulfurirhabdus thermomarina]NMX23564.1 1-deoxy-D-xylulose-5-phosphate reductoisomerase [Dissulfurirhabdus thermomarina]
MKRLSILGSTGSIGRSVLDVVRRFPGRFQVAALAAGRNVALAAEQVREFRPGLVAVLTRGLADELAGRLGDAAVEIRHGKEGYKAVAEADGVDLVVSAMVGAAGLEPTLAALEAGRDVALANKETLVTAGPLVTRIAAERGRRILPVDSEHSALFQSMEGHRRCDVRRLVLTASGGPFRGRPRSELAGVTPEEAVAHPNWSMGAKISVDSATLMNKGLEVIEARWLFDVPVDRIDVLVHPQSIVHSMVEYVDGSVVAQMGIPDMRIPIAYALAWPERLPLDLPRLDLARAEPLTFEPPDLERFPCLALAYEAARAGGTAPTALNAANEVAVEAFLGGRLPFLAIPRVVRAVLEDFPAGRIERLEDVLSADALARVRAEAAVERLGAAG